MHMKQLFALLIGVLVLAPAQAAETADPWGSATLTEIDYAPQKVVYDVATRDMEAFELVLDRASYLSQLYHADPFAASIVLVLHGSEIGYFAIENHAEYKELMTRAQSLTVGDVIEIRICKVAAEGRGYAVEDLHGFTQVVPMADAEIIRLQQEKGYAYMQ